MGTVPGEFYPRPPSSATRAPARNRLLEALVGVSVLMVIGAVLFPAIAQDHGSRKVLALSNIKECAIGTEMYAGDFDDHLPNAHRWMDLTLHYMRNETLFHATDLAEPSPEAYGLAFRTRLSHKKEGGIAEPAKTAMIFDSTLPFRNAASELWSLPDPPRHGNGKTNVVAFADGHVKLVNKEASQNLQ